MFAGLPGIGVGTLYYVLAAFWMPLRELARVLRGDFSPARWRLVVMQLCFAISIIASIAAADRILGVILSEGSIRSITPARLVNEAFQAQAPHSFWSAPMTASLLLLAGVLVITEVMRLIAWMARRPRAQRLPALREITE
jgi:hypothetical protein